MYACVGFSCVCTGTCTTGWKETAKMATAIAPWKVLRSLQSLCNHDWWYLEPQDSPYFTTISCHIWWLLVHEYIFKLSNGYGQMGTTLPFALQTGDIISGRNGECTASWWRVGYRGTLLWCKREQEEQLPTLHHSQPGSGPLVPLSRAELPIHLSTWNMNLILFQSNKQKGTGLHPVHHPYLWYNNPLLLLFKI